jgi:uncharacterized paraquat-inducible protein A
MPAIGFCDANSAKLAPGQTYRQPDETMPPTKNLTCPCAVCGVSIDFPAERIGQTAQCPHCGSETDLLLAAPPEQPPATRRLLVWTLTGILILLFGLAAAIFALNRAEKWAAWQKEKAGEPAKP